MKTDAQLQKDVEDELKWQPILRTYQIKVSVQDGIAELSGTVNSYKEKTSIEILVFMVPGIKGIKKNITINCGSTLQKNNIEHTESTVNSPQNQLTPLQRGRCISELHQKKSPVAIWIPGFYYVDNKKHK